MKSKTASCLLVISLSFSIGCYSTEMMTKQTLQDRPEQADLTVYTRDSLEYEFPGEHYSIRGDTLAGDSVSIPFANITSIELKEFDVPLTIAVGSSVVLIGALVMEIVSAWNTHGWPVLRWKLK